MLYHDREDVLLFALRVSFEYESRRRKLISKVKLAKKRQLEDNKVRIKLQIYIERRD